MRVFLKIAVSFATVAGIVFAGYHFVSHPIFGVNDIVIEAIEPHAGSVLFERIRGDLAVRLIALRGKSIWDLDLEGIMGLIEKDLRVKEASVTRQLPDVLHVKIEPHTPVALIMNKKMNRLYPVARNGEMLPSVSLKEANDAPILRGDIFLKELKMREQALGILRLLPERGPFSYKTVSEIDYDKRRGFQFRLQPEGIQVLLGHEDFPSRIKHAGRVVEYLKTEQLQSRVIDARFTKKVVVKLRNDP